jgi:glucokinase
MRGKSNTVMIVAGDIGGTKTSLALFSPEQGPTDPVVEKTFPSARYDSLEAIVAEFMHEVEAPVSAACFGVAGPVAQGRARTTNLPWTIDAEQLRATLHLDAVQLLNDLESVAHGVLALEPSDLHTLNEGQAAPGGAVAVIAPGTGLGEAYMTWNGSTYSVHASEGGHSSFGPTNELEIGLLRYLQNKFGHVSYERVCSGIGLPNIYDYLNDSQHAEPSPHVIEQLSDATDSVPVIVNAALQNELPCQLCRSTLECFVSILGAEAGNLALKVLATGGVYVGGGIPPRILGALEEDNRFMQSFRNKGRFANMLGRVPVHVVLNTNTALLGAGSYGLNNLLEVQAGA